MLQQQRIEAFLQGSPHAVLGASPDRTKFGNKVLRTYMQAGRPAVPVHPTAKVVEGVTAYPSLLELPETPHGISIITQPAVTVAIVRQAASLGIRHVWMQPGAESAEAIELAEDLGLNVIAGGPCLLIVLGFRDE